MVFIIAVLLTYALAFDVNIPKSSELCFGTDIEMHTLFVGEVAMRNKKTDYTLNIDVIDPSQKHIFMRQRINEISFSFTSTESGSHDVCIRNLAENETSISIDIKTGAMAKDYSAAASTKVLQETDLRIERIKEASRLIHQEIQHLRVREEELRGTNDTIHSRVIAYSISSFVLLLFVAFFQTLYFKRYFKSKKMI